jgi:hypothetical protein
MVSIRKSGRSEKAASSVQRTVSKEAADTGYRVAYRETKELRVTDCELRTTGDSVHPRKDNDRVLGLRVQAFGVRGSKQKKNN